MCSPELPPGWVVVKTEQNALSPNVTRHSCAISTFICDFVLDIEQKIDLIHLSASNLSTEIPAEMCNNEGKKPILDHSSCIKTW